MNQMILTMPYRVYTPQDLGHFHAVSGHDVSGHRKRVCNTKIAQQQSTGQTNIPGNSHRVHQILKQNNAPATVTTTNTTTICRYPRQEFSAQILDTVIPQDAGQILGHERSPSTALESPAES